MPSRKKAKGKARKAAKEAKAKEEEESQAVIAANQRQEGSLEAQLQRLIVSQQCKHGCHSFSADEEKICLEFITAFIDTFNSQDNVGGGFITALHTTIVEYHDVYSSKLEAIISIFLYNGTQCILDGDNYSKAQLYASFACYFEHMMDLKTATCDWAKIIELYDADHHTLVSYYRKRIPCSCLDETYKSVKSVKKMGHCCNKTCSLPGKKVERSKMFRCTRCGVVNYCSVECQRVDWKAHREECNRTAETKAALSTEQS